MLARLALLAASMATAGASSYVTAPQRALSPISGDACALGFDFGTSGVRCAVVDAAGKVVASPEGYPWGERERAQTCDMWREALVARAPFELLLREREGVGRVVLARANRLHAVAATQTGSLRQGPSLQSTVSGRHTPWSRSAGR